ncbi:hypothetical protein DPMN_033469 [Dreissena polymorpha]|uniref:Uncharacterized protein n=1 Tax=Dreissena polymorpha TaxID=45954 RepID=A0A9D4RL01_DREPO|nr:hypothetical protein DPMN_033469 [Dreissena polymorpha]
MGKCRFKPGWLTEYYWVQKNKGHSKSTLSGLYEDHWCRGMGESALKSHEKEETHKENIKLRSNVFACNNFKK